MTKRLKKRLLERSADKLLRDPGRPENALKDTQGELLTEQLALFLGAFRCERV